MRSQSFHAVTHRASLFVIATAVACSGGDSPSPGPGPGPGPSASIAVTVGAATLTINAGGAATAIATISRTAFTGTVAVSVSGLPTGVTLTSNTQTTTGSVTTVTLAFAAAGSASAGTSTLTISASGAGVSTVSATFALTVQSVSTGSFTLTAAPATHTLVQGTNGQSSITISRTGGFTGAVALTVQGQVTGLSAALNPASTTGNTSTLTVTAGATLAAATYTITVEGVGSNGVQRVTTVAVTVTASGGSQQATLNFAACQALAKPIWVAYQDGDGPWMRVPGTADVYTFTITQSRGGYAYVTAPQAGSSRRTTTIFLGSRSEVTSNGAPNNFCPAPSQGRVLIGSVTGVIAGQSVNVSSGNRYVSATSILPQFTLNGIPTGPHDLVAFRTSPIPGAADRGIIRQDLNLANGASAGVLDMNGSESFAAVTASMTVNGFTPGATLIGGTALVSGASCDASILTSGSFQASPYVVSGIPDARLRPTDMHQLTTVMTTTTGLRQLTEIFHSLVDRQVNLPSEIVPIVIPAPGNYKRFNAVFALPAEYNQFVAMTMAVLAGTNNSVSMVATRNWLGQGNGGVFGLVMPVFSGVAGWDDGWGPASNALVQWTLSAGGSNFSAGQTQCTAGLRNVAAARFGTI